MQLMMLRNTTSTPNYLDYRYTPTWIKNGVKMPKDLDETYETLANARFHSHEKYPTKCLIYQIDSDLRSRFVTAIARHDPDQYSYRQLEAMATTLNSLGCSEVYKYLVETLAARPADRARHHLKLMTSWYNLMDCERIAFGRMFERILNREITETTLTYFYTAMLTKFARYEQLRFLDEVDAMQDNIEDPDEN
jgi:hypothetical protein